MKKNFFAALLLGLSNLFGCATPNNYPQDPAQQLDFHIGYAIEYAEKNDFDRVAYHVNEALGKQPSNDKLREVIKNNTKIQSGLLNHFCENPKKITDKQILTDRMLSIKKISESGVLPDAGKCKAAVDMAANRAELDWLLSDNWEAFDSLKSPEAQKKIFERTLDQVSDSRRKLAIVQSLAKYLANPERTNTEKDIAKQRLSKSTLHRAELSELKNVYPDLVERKLKELTAYVQVTITPPDRLTEEDIKEGIKKASANFVILAKGEAGGKDTININYEKLRLEERQLPAQSQTITYAQHEVNLMMAALFMPRNASYIYEWTSGGVEIEYGYAIRATQNGKILLDDLFRGTLTKTFVNCTNPRIVNVFGGSTRADFVANDDMTSRCSGATSSVPTIQSARKELTTLLINKATSVEPLASRLEP
ncbi:MAG: hypothetical protein HY850_03930 [Betaproteobacteria bacterium]|nr:hypothetical protein [Betaproteobacteria bacterium]